MSRAAVYAAEDQWSALLDRGGIVDFFGSRLDLPQQRRFGDIESVRRYVEHVLQLGPVRQAFPDPLPVTVRERAGQTKAHYEPDKQVIAVPMQAAWAGREAVVLHELAHHLSVGRFMQEGGPVPGTDDWHGPRYRLAMCRLVAAVLGDTAALLLRAGYEVLEGVDGRDGLVQLDKATKVHLIVSDVNMPNMDGIAFVTQVKQHPRHKFTPVIMLTTEGQDEKKAQGRAAGAKAWIVKPFNPPQLLDAVSKLILP